MGYLTFSCHVQSFSNIAFNFFGSLRERFIFYLRIRMMKVPAREKSYKRSNQLILTHLIYYQVPDPVSFFPLNGIFGTREIQDRTSEGIQSDVALTTGQNGYDSGSYEFSGTLNSYIEFSNSDGGVLDVRNSITLLFWVYNAGQDGPLLQYNTGASDEWGVTFWLFNERPFVAFNKRSDYQPPSPLVADAPLDQNVWTFVGASYDHTSGEQSLWVDGVLEKTSNIGANLELATQDSVRIGARDVFCNDPFGYFTGRITQVGVYDVALTQAQVQEIKGKIIL